MSLTGGGLKYYTELEVITGETPHLLRFYIADMGPDDLILGYPWFAVTNAHCYDLFSASPSDACYRLPSETSFTFPFHQPRHLPFYCHTSLLYHLPTWLSLILIPDSDSLCLPSYLRRLVRYFNLLWQAVPRPLLYLTLASTTTKP